MHVEGTSIAGLQRFIPRPHRDARGFFVRTFDAHVMEQAGLQPATFVQDSQSRSGQGTVRGLHLRTDGREAKLVRCARGAIFDVVVDMRLGSPTFGTWESFQLDDAELSVLHIPPGCAHGFQVLSPEADVCYRMDAPYASEWDASVSYADPSLAIAWPRPVVGLSERDRSAPLLRDVRPVRLPADRDR